MTENAKELFHVGQRVKLSPDGLSHLAHQAGNRTRVPHDAKLRGTVRGFGHEAGLLRVQRDGIKTTDRYHMDFWEAE